MVRGANQRGRRGQGEKGEGREGKGRVEEGGDGRSGRGEGRGSVGQGWEEWEESCRGFLRECPRGSFGGSLRESSRGSP